MNCFIKLLTIVIFLFGLAHEGKCDEYFLFPETTINLPNDWSEIDQSTLIKYFPQGNNKSSKFNFGFQLKTVPPQKIKYPYILIRIENKRADIQTNIDMLKSFDNMKDRKLYFDLKRKIFWYQTTKGNMKVIAGNFFLGFKQIHVYGYSTQKDFSKWRPILIKSIETICQKKNSHSQTLYILSQVIYFFIGIVIISFSFFLPVKYRSNVQLLLALSFLALGSLMYYLGTNVGSNRILTSYFSKCIIYLASLFSHIPGSQYEKNNWIWLSIVSMGRFSILFGFLLIIFRLVSNYFPKRTGNRNAG